jgi:glycosyltransferase involved in cell wall biosynthesis
MIAAQAPFPELRQQCNVAPVTPGTAIKRMMEPRQLRVLFGTYPWAFETPGGGEVQIDKYAKYLPSHGVEVRRHDSWKSNLAGASVFHFFSCTGGSIHFCAYVKKRGLPLVISSSLWISEQTRHLYPIDEIRAQLSLADMIVTNSRAESDLLSRLLEMPPDRFATVFNGFEPDFALADPKPFRDRFNIRGPFILNVANIEPRKNQLGLVRSLKGLGVPLVMIGSRRNNDYADAVMAEAGPEARYLGPLGHDDPGLASAFAACTVFALPSTLETPGLAALEASACGAPLVVTSEGPTREYFAEHAHYVDHGDPADIRRGILAAMAAGPDPVLRQRVVTQFPWTTVTAELVKVYRKAVERAELESVKSR